MDGKLRNLAHILAEFWWTIITKHAPTYWLFDIDGARVRVTVEIVPGKSVYGYSQNDNTTEITSVTPWVVAGVNKYDDEEIAAGV